MKPLFDFKEIREIEKQVIEKENFPSILLMENAGKNSFDVILSKIPSINEYMVFIFCGKGNNAGDGYTVARHLLINGIDLSIVQVEESALKGDAQINYELLIKCGLSNEKIISLDSIKQISKQFSSKSKILIIDAVLGTGISGSLSEKYEDAIKTINKLRKKLNRSLVISLDIPSGLMSGKQLNPLVNADITITMGAMKAELLFGEGKENSGEVFTVPIGITDNLINKYDIYKKCIIDHTDAPFIFPKRKKSSYKYSNGKVLVIGGSKGLSGAVIMSSLAAIKSGAGAVTAGVPESIASLLGKKHFEIMRLELGENSEGSISANSYEKIEKRLNWCNAVLVGPGISVNDNTKLFVFRLIENSDKDLVIDADALTLIASDPEVLLRRKNNINIILTPHIGEFSRISKISVEEIELNRFEAVRNFSAQYKVNVVLKSETTISCLTGGEIFVNSTGNEALATAGTGDVLSGIIASLLSQTGDVKTAMLCGNYLHGLCAVLYFEKYKNKQTASPQDIINLIPKAVSRILGK